MALDPKRTYVVGSDLDDARRVCVALDLPLGCARSVRTAADSLRGMSTYGMRVLITRYGMGCLTNPSPTTQRSKEALEVLGDLGALVFSL